MAKRSTRPARPTEVVVYGHDVVKIVFVPADKDYRVEVDGAVIGWAPTLFQAKTMAEVAREARLKELYGA